MLYHVRDYKGRRSDSHMARSSQAQQEFVENVFLAFLGPLLWVLPEYGSLFLFENFKRQDLLDPDFFDPCIWVRPLKVGGMYNLEIIYTFYVL